MHRHFNFGNFWGIEVAVWELGGWKIRHRVACQGDIDEAALFHVSLTGCKQLILTFVYDLSIILYIENDTVHSGYRNHLHMDIHH